MNVSRHPAVAVILPTLNGRAFIGEQLDALLAQEVDFDWHIVVVDGGSSDGTVEFVESYIERSTSIQLVRLTDSPGVNAGINAGVSSTSSEYLVIAEHDDVVAPGWLSALRAALASNHIVGSRIDKSALNDPSILMARRRFAEDIVVHVPFVDATGMGFRRSVWEELGGFDETYRYGGNDAEFCFRAHRLGYRSVSVDDACVLYRLRGTPRETFHQARAYGVSTVRLYREFGSDYLSRRPLRSVAKELARLLWWSKSTITDPGYRLLVCYRGGLQLGYLRGSLMFRRWFP